MDWKKIIAELSAAGITQTEIAEKCHCGQSTISEIGRGDIKNPSFMIGKGLLDLHAEKFGTCKEAS